MLFASRFSSDLCSSNPYVGGMGAYCKCSGVYCHGVTVPEEPQSDC